MTHAFLPPHPGPVAAAGLLHVQLGWVILMGTVCGIPAVLAAWAYAAWIGQRIFVAVPQDMVEAAQEAKRAVVAEQRAQGVVALTLALLLAYHLLGIRRGWSRKSLETVSTEGERGGPGPVGHLPRRGPAGDGPVVSHLPGPQGGPGLGDGRDRHHSGHRGAPALGRPPLPALRGPGHHGDLRGLRLRLTRQRRCPRAERADGCSWMVAKYFGISERDTPRTWTVLESVLSVAGFGVAVVVSLCV